MLLCSNWRKTLDGMCEISCFPGPPFLKAMGKRWSIGYVGKRSHVQSLTPPGRADAGSGIATLGLVRYIALAWSGGFLLSLLKAVTTFPTCHVPRGKLHEISPSNYPYPHLVPNWSWFWGPGEGRQALEGDAVVQRASSCHLGISQSSHKLNTAVGLKPQHQWWYPLYYQEVGYTWFLMKPLVPIRSPTMYQWCENGQTSECTDPANMTLRI